MKKLFVLIVAIVLSLNFAFAADTRMTCDVTTLVDADGLAVTSENPLAITSGESDYLYVAPSTQRSGAFSCQLMVTSTAPLDIDIQGQVSLHDSGTFANAWCPGDNEGSLVTITTTAAVEEYILSAIRLPVTIPARKMRIRLFNNGTVPLDVTGGILASW